MTNRPRRSECVIVCVLLALLYVRVVASTRQHSITTDEFAHLPAGMRHLARGDFRVYGTTPPLGRVVPALAVLAMGVAVPDRAQDEHEWDVGYRFERENRTDYLAIFARARLAAAGLVVPLGVVLWAWSRRIWGSVGGVFSLTVLAFEPNVIAHAGLVGTDLALALSVVLSLIACARLGRRPGLLDPALAGAAIGAALLSKHTAFLLLPVLVAAALWLCRGWRRVLLTVTTAAVTALLVLNLGYGFQGSFQLLSDYRFASRELRRLPAWPLPLPVPSEWLEGVDREFAVLGQGFPCFLNGRFYRQGGPWYYDIEGLLLKTPLAELALIAVALVVLVRHPPGRASPGLAGPARASLGVAALFSALLLLSASVSRLDEGVRYLLCLFPVAAFAAGAVAVRAPRLAAVLCVLLAAESLASYPDELAFFNFAARAGTAPLDRIGGSNLDLCQDLPKLARELDARGIALPGIACLGRVDPLHYGIRYRLARPPFEPGWYAISAAYLQGWRYVLRDPDSDAIVWSDYGDYRPFRSLTPVARVGPAIYLYHLEQRLEAPAN